MANDLIMIFVTAMTLFLSSCLTAKTNIVRSLALLPSLLISLSFVHRIPLKLNSFSVWWSLSRDIWQRQSVSFDGHNIHTEIFARAHLPNTILAPFCLCFNFVYAQKLNTIIDFSTITHCIFTVLTLVLSSCLLLIDDLNGQFSDLLYFSSFHFNYSKRVDYVQFR